MCWGGLGSSQSRRWMSCCRIAGLRLGLQRRPGRGRFGHGRLLGAQAFPPGVERALTYPVLATIGPNRFASAFLVADSPVPLLAAAWFRLHAPTMRHRSPSRLEGFM